MVLPGKVWLAVICAAVWLPCAVEGATALSELRGLRTRESRIPVYNKERLQLLLYSQECFQKGRLLETINPVLDIIRKDADIDTIDTGKDTKIYPLGAPFAEVLKFWSGHLFSDGVVVSDKADFDQENKLAAGGGPVFFRSPMLDLNGVGFDADYGKKTIFVRRNVNIVLRTAASDPLKYIKSGKALAKYEFLRATSDNMLIDMTRRVITLAGHVRVHEERGVILCERMLIHLPTEKGKKKDAGDDEMRIRGISRVICEGNVRVHRTGGSEVQQAFGEKMDYDLGTGLLRLTGTVSKLPLLRQGKNSLQGRRIDMYRNREYMQVLQDCRMIYFQKDSESGKMVPLQAFSDRMDFDNRGNLGVLTGHVRVIDPRFTLHCGRMDIRLAENGPADKKQKAAASEITGIPDLAVSGKKELKTMHCYGGVRLVRQGEPGAEPQTASAQEAQMTYPQQVVTMTGSNPTLSRGNDSLSGDKLTIDMKSRNLVAEPNSRIVFRNADKDPKGGKMLQTEVLSDRADLGYNSNLLVFTGNVKVRDPRMELDCRKMDIHLKDAPDSAGKTAPAKAEPGMASIAGPNGKKLLDKIICTGDVKVRESRMKMDSDKLTLLFRQAANRKTPGMFQSNGTELVQILPEGNVMMENIPVKKTASKAEDGKKKAATGMPGFRSDTPMRLTADRGKVDFPKNLTEFHGDVKVREEQGQLDCEDLYLYSKNVTSTPGKKAAPAKTGLDALDALDALDDDPYSKVSGASQVPTFISLGDGKALERVEALKNVVLVRQLPSGGKQRATGEKAEYFVDRRLVELTGEPPEYAQITDANPQNNGRGRKITVFLDRESVAFDGRVQMEFDGKKGTPGVDL